jgi:hypothetical protein
MSTMERLTGILRSVAISEYLGDFIAAGFFTWNDLLNITVSHLEINFTTAANLFVGK